MFCSNKRASSEMDCVTSKRIKSGEVVVSLVDTNEKPGGNHLVEYGNFSRSTQLDLVDLARQIQTADNFTKANASSKLTVIAEQVRFLQEQAQRVLEEANFNAELHHLPCNFKKVPGNVYYIYQRPTGQRYFSMISPQEWGSSCPHVFIGAYRLEHDMSWTPSVSMERKSRELEAINKLLDFTKLKGTKAITDGVQISMKLGPTDELVDMTNCTDHL